MRMFTNATVSSMSQASPGFAMANNLMQEQANRPMGRPPPAPVETKNMPPQQRPGMVFTESNNRPDLAAGRGAMFREQGQELNNGFERLDEPQRTVRPMQMPPQPQQMSMPQQPQQMQMPRPEMRGPQSTDIDNILSGLKTRSVNIHEAPTVETVNEDDSMISISSLKDVNGSTMPKRSNRRKNGSAKNTISLDI